MKKKKQTDWVIVIVVGLVLGVGFASILAMGSGNCSHWKTRALVAELELQEHDSYLQLVVLDDIHQMHQLDLRYIQETHDYDSQDLNASAAAVQRVLEKFCKDCSQPPVSPGKQPAQCSPTRRKVKQHENKKLNLIDVPIEYRTQLNSGLPRINAPNPVIQGWTY